MIIDYTSSHKCEIYAYSLILFLNSSITLISMNVKIKIGYECLIILFLNLVAMYFFHFLNTLQIKGSVLNSLLFLRHIYNSRGF